MNDSSFCSGGKFPNFNLFVLSLSILKTHKINKNMLCHTTRLYDAKLCKNYYTVENNLLLSYS